MLWRCHPQPEHATMMAIAAFESRDSGLRSTFGTVGPIPPWAMCGSLEPMALGDWEYAATASSIQGARQGAVSEIEVHMVSSARNRWRTALTSLLQGALPTATNETAGLHAVCACRLLVNPSSNGAAAS